MRLADFDFELPDELIAQEPAAERSASRLLRLERNRKQITHEQFTDLAVLLREGDLLVRNETRVLPARIIGRKQSGGQIEVLLVRQLDAEGNLWRCLTRSSKPSRSGCRITFSDDLGAEVVAVEEGGERQIRFHATGDFFAILEQIGHMPLPPYIRRADSSLDRERYQTVFANNPGAIAAPTAGLHFSEATFTALAERNIEVCGLTLHVGPGTFLPVRVDDLSEHRMHTEVYDVPEATAVKINRARSEGRRIIALGTTVARTLEAAVDAQGELRSGSAETDIFIRPGFVFQMVDALFTNFHLPKSTLLMLVSAFAGRDFILEAYREAVDKRYRFFSYGDCMLIE